MNKLESTFELYYSAYNKIENTSFTYKNDTICITKNSGKMFTDISGNSEENIFNTQRLIEDLFYIYLGFFPKLISQKYNKCSVDLDKRAEKYESYDYENRPYMATSNIDNTTINEKVLSKLDKLDKISLYSMQYLTCKAYKNVTSTHKIVLLLHVVDGVYNAIKKDTDAHYCKKVKWLCNEYLFAYNGYIFLELLNINKKTFISSISDTRNWFSHFLENKKRKRRIVKGEKNILYFYLISFMIRLALSNHISGIEADKKDVNEYYNVIYDWYTEEVLKENKPRKSNTYTQIDSFRCVNNFINSKLPNN